LGKQGEVRRETAVSKSPSASMDPYHHRRWSDPRSWQIKVSQSTLIASVAVYLV